MNIDNRRARVYVTQKPPTARQGNLVYFHIDLTPASKLGDIHFLSNRGDVERGTVQSLLWAFRSKLKEYDCEKDYILPIGHTITMAIAAIVAAENGQGMIQILQWDKRIREYEIFKLDLHAQP